MRLSQASDPVSVFPLHLRSVNPRSQHFNPPIPKPRRLIPAISPLPDPDLYKAPHARSRPPSYVVCYKCIEACDGGTIGADSLFDFGGSRWRTPVLAIEVGDDMP